MEIKNQIENALNHSVTNTFTATLSMNPQKTGEIELPQNNSLIISSIGITGKIDGSISLWLHEPTACKIVSKMLCMELEENSSDVIDGIGEVMNMIAGGTKTLLDNTEYKFAIGIPSTIRGNHLEYCKSQKTSDIIQNYTCEDFQFAVKLTYCIHEDNENRQNDEKKEPSMNAFDKLSQLVEQKNSEQANN